MFWEILASADDGLTFSATVGFWTDEVSWAGGAQPVLEDTFAIVCAGRTFLSIVTNGGEYQRVDGTWVIPWVEVNGAWEPLVEDPQNPWARHLIDVDIGARLAEAVEAFVAREFK